MGVEIPTTFKCAGDQLVGILHSGEPESSTGVVFVVGGPQYRAGSHRQFVLMARAISSAGNPVLRFDYRSMGDSDGDSRSFESVEKDIRAGVDELVRYQPSVRSVVLLGLCDAASANLMYAATDDRVRGLILLNPWVRTLHSEASTFLKHYYLQRLLQKSFWRKVFSGRFSLSDSIRQLFGVVRDSRSLEGGTTDSLKRSGESFVQRMLSGFEKFNHPVLILISGRDLTAQEFVDLCKKDDSWRNCLDRPDVTIRHFPDADHTLSTRQHLRDSMAFVANWLAERNSCE